MRKVKSKGIEGRRATILEGLKVILSKPKITLIFGIRNPMNPFLLDSRELKHLSDGEG